MFGLAHFDTTPLIYGLVIFLGLFSMIYKIKRHLWFPFFVEVFIFWLVFKLHGGSMAGGFAATVAALIAGVTVPMMFRTKR